MPGMAPRRMKAAEAAPTPPEWRAWEPALLFSGQARRARSFPIVLCDLRPTGRLRAVFMVFICSVI
jgi:hypothetical protein